MNHLAEESSLYLRQHAENPVDWHPWGESALRQAREEDKPLLVSIGYSACHWCHVMERECFENEYIAKLMNDNFICIKVDREERPDIDQIYMEAVQMMNGHGGWPLNVFCLPDGRPFAGGTYFPPEDRGQGLIPWPQLLTRVVDHYRRNRDALHENAEAILGNLGSSNRLFQAAEAPLAPQALPDAAEQLCEEHDDQYGGFGGTPKFPPSMTLEFLVALRGAAAVESARPTLARRIDSVVPATLTAIARGGIFDQIGGGFARYSVDRVWLIPHFEKMLYDNALLIDIYARAWRRYRAPLFRAVVIETLEWLEREMRLSDGGYAASIDADSEGVEGKYYVWSPEQIHEVLGADRANAFCEAYGITPEGNFENGFSNPALLQPDMELRDSLAADRQQLLEARERRVPPARDPKRLTAWNALLLRGMAEAGFSLGESTILARAAALADFLWDRMRGDGDRLHAVLYEDGPRQNGLLDDYAFLIEGLLTLASYAEALGHAEHKRFFDRAVVLTNRVLEHFSDPSGDPGFFFTPDDHEDLVHRHKDWFDNATPSGNSALVHSFSILHAITGDSRYSEEMEKLRRCYPPIVEKAPAAVVHALAAWTEEAKGPAVVKLGSGSDTQALSDALRKRPWRRLALMPADDSSAPAGYQVCVGPQCQPPTTDPAAAAEMV